MNTSVDRESTSEKPTDLQIHPEELKHTDLAVTSLGERKQEKQMKDGKSAGYLPNSPHLSNKPSAAGLSGNRVIQVIKQISVPPGICSSYCKN